MPANFENAVANGYEVRESTLSFDLPYLQFTLPSQSSAGGGENYPLEVCGELEYTIVITSIKSDTSKIVVVKDEPTTINSGSVSIQTNDQ